MRKRKRLNCVGRFKMSKVGFQRRVEFTPTTRFGQAPPGHHQAGCAVVGACPGQVGQVLGCTAPGAASCSAGDSSHPAPRCDRQNRPRQAIAPSHADPASAVPALTAGHPRRRGTSPASTRCASLASSPHRPTRRPPGYKSGSPPVSSRSSSVYSRAAAQRRAIRPTVRWVR